MVCLHNSVAEALFVLGVCERTVECYISKFPVVRSYGNTSFAPGEELIVFAYQICKPQFLSVVQSPFDNCRHRSLRQRFLKPVYAKMETRTCGDGRGMERAQKLLYFLI